MQNHRLKFYREWPSSFTNQDDSAVPPCSLSMGAKDRASGRGWCDVRRAQHSETCESSRSESDGLEGLCICVYGKHR